MNKQLIMIGTAALLTAGSMLIGVVIWSMCWMGLSPATLPSNVIWLTIGCALIAKGGDGFRILLQKMQPKFDE